MKITASHLGNIVLTILLAFVLVMFAQETFAADSEEQIQDGKVEVIYPIENTAPYRDRKENRSIIFGFSNEKPVFKNFRSRIDDLTYDEIYKSNSVDFFQGELGLKYNFGVGGLGASLMYGYGEVDRSNNGFNSTLTVAKKGAKLTYTMDTLFKEPYVAPYATVQLLNWDWTEKLVDTTTDARETKSGSTQWTTGFQGGFLIQLNWMDPDSALTAQNSSGMNNAFLDIFVSQYAATTGSEDPNFLTDMTYGGGLKLEF